MTSTFPTEEMKQDRGAALVRIRKQQREEETLLLREMDQPVWRDWVFWLGVILLGSRVNGTSEPTWPLGLIVLTVALDRVSRRRSRAARDLQKLLEEKELFLNK